MSTTKRTQADAFSDNQLDLEWHLKKHARVNSSPLLDLSQYLDLNQSSFSPQTPEPELLRVEAEAARRGINALGERWQKSLQALAEDGIQLRSLKDSGIRDRLSQLEHANNHKDKLIGLLELRLTHLERDFKLRSPTITKPDDDTSQSTQQQDLEVYRRDVQATAVCKSPTPLLDSRAASASHIFDAPPARAVRLSNLPATLVFDKVHQLIRGGPVEQIFYHDGESSAVVWFITPQSAKLCLAHASTYEVIIEGHTIEYEIMETNLSRSPPGPSVLDAPACNISTTLFIDRSTRPIAVIRDDFEVHGKLITCARLNSGTVRVVYSSVHDAINAMRVLPNSMAYQESTIRFYKDDCSEPLSRSWLLRECSTRKRSSINLQMGCSSIPRSAFRDTQYTIGAQSQTIRPELISAAAQDEPSQLLTDAIPSSLYNEERTGITDTTFTSPATPIRRNSSKPRSLASVSREEARNLDAEPANKIPHYNTEDRDDPDGDHSQEYPVETINPRRHYSHRFHPPRPRGACKFCGTRHWFTGPNRTPCPTATGEAPSRRTRFDKRTKSPVYTPREEDFVEVRR